MRSFACVAALCAAAVVLVGCQSTVSFPRAPFSEQDRANPVIAAALAKPDGNGPFPAVVLLHSCGGVMDHLHDWSRFFTERGYAVLMVDTFGSRGLGRCPNGVHSSTLAQVEMVSDAYGALDYLAARPEIAADRIYVMGFSLGGWAVRTMASREPLSRANRRFRAGIALYDGCQGYGERMTFPTMVVIGTLDGRDFNSCASAAKHAPSADLEVEILEGAYHAFDQNVGTTIRTDVGGRPMLYDPRAHRKARELVEAYLQRH